MAEKTAPAKKNVLLASRQTEKAVLAEHKANVYAFNVSLDATKPAIAAAIREQYKVTPTKVNVVSSQGMKKAYIYLKKGDKISA